MLLNDFKLGFILVNRRQSLQTPNYRSIKFVFYGVKEMKKISTLFAAGMLSLLSATAFACPQGTTLTGGTGANHKGGKCVAAATVKHQSQAAKHEASQAQLHATKAKHDAVKAEQHRTAAMQKDVKQASHEQAKAVAETNAAKHEAAKAKTAATHAKIDAQHAHTAAKPVKS